MEAVRGVGAPCRLLRLSNTLEGFWPKVASGADPAIRGPENTAFSLSLFWGEFWESEFEGFRTE